MLMPSVRPAPRALPVRSPRRLLLALAMLGAACARDASPVVIGAAGPWTESYGEMDKRGVELAVEEINARGGVRGRPLRVIERDDQGDGSRAAQIAADYLDNRSVVAVVGHVTSGAMMAAARIYDHGLPAIATSASSPDLSGISPWVFRVIPSDSANGTDIAHFVDALGMQHVAVLYENTPYGRGLTEAFRRNYVGSLVAELPIPAEERSNFEPYVSFLRARAPDAVFVAGTVSSALGLLREARRQHFTGAFIGSDGWTGVTSDTASAEGSYVAAPFTPRDARPEARRFVNAFRAKYGVDPDGNAALGYDATCLVAQAIEAVGPSRSRVREWLARLDAKTAFQGVTGSLRFSAQGDVIGHTLIMSRVHDGALLVASAGAG